jgi:hypothetical protein
VTERQLQDAVIACARLLGWKVAHFRPAQTAKGWRTPVEADGAGFPDLILAHPSNGMAVYAVELKAAAGRILPAQQGWLDVLEQAGCHTAVWRPDDWRSGRIEAQLRLTTEPPTGRTT